MKTVVCQMEERPVDILMSGLQKVLMHGVEQHQLAYRTTLGFNEAEKLHVNTVDACHPESPDRIRVIFSRLDKNGWIQNCNVITEYRSIDREDLLRVHDAEYVDSILEMKEEIDQSVLNDFAHKFDSVFLAPGSVDAALDAVACCRELIELILELRIPNGFAFVRPPGHHAGSSEACGFSLFNNVALAAEHALDFGAERVLIVDLDVHHGQATQRIFYENDRGTGKKYSGHGMTPDIEPVSDWRNDLRSKNSSDRVVQESYLGIAKKTRDANTERLKEFVLSFDPNKDSGRIWNTIKQLNGQRTYTPHWKAATIIPLAKPAKDTSEGESYRPISLLSAVAKTLERLIGPFINEHLLPPSHQHGLRVLYTSIHRYEHGNFWPHLEESGSNFVGFGLGAGYNVNIPLNTTRCGDSDYLAIFWHVIWPVAMEFNPDIVIISAGFDSCKGDPLGEMDLSPHGYGHIVYQLSALAKGKMLLVLEGGYHHELSAAAAESCVSVLCGEKPVKLSALKKLKPETVESCLMTIEALTPYWSCLDFYKDERIANKRNGGNGVTHFRPLPEEERENTGNVLQENLVKIDYENIRASEDRRPLIVFNNPELESKHLDDGHPESPARTQMIYSKLENAGLLARSCVVQADNAWRELSEEETTRQLLPLAHDRPYINRLQRTTMMSEKELENEEERLDSIYLTNHSFKVAASTAATVVQTTKTLLGKGLVGGAACWTRPPGHHANQASPSGFCLLNNVALAALSALDSRMVEKVLILDWDVHHGNGTQDIFYEDNRVLFISLHRHDKGSFYPIGALKDYGDVGEGPGRGFNVNIPWSGRKMGDAEYRAVFAKVVLPIAYDFCPDLVLVSAGFDAAFGDPLGEFAVHPVTFGLMTHQLAALAGGKIVTVLEGGYNVKTVADCAERVTEVLTDGRFKRNINEGLNADRQRVCREAWSCIMKVMKTQKEFWNSLKDFEVDIAGDQEEDAVFPEVTDSLPEDWEMASSSSAPAPVPDDYSHMFAVVPLESCPHLTQVEAVPSGGIDPTQSCQTCGTATEIWVCLSCYQTHCGREIAAHGLRHFQTTLHPMALSFSDFSVWCYSCDAYVHNQVLFEAKNEVHTRKFGVQIPH